MNSACRQLIVPGLLAPFSPMGEVGGVDLDLLSAAEEPGASLAYACAKLWFDNEWSAGCIGEAAPARRLVKGCWYVASVDGKGE